MKNIRKVLVLLLMVATVTAMAPQMSFAESTGDGKAVSSAAENAEGGSTEDPAASSTDGGNAEDADSKSTDDADAEAENTDAEPENADAAENAVPEKTATLAAEEDDADPTVKYETHEGEAQVADGEYTPLSRYTLFPTLYGSTTPGSYGVYVVDQNISIDERVIIQGNVKLILMNGMTFNCTKGITVTGDNTLEIYGQNAFDYSQAGNLVATGENDNSGIGGTEASPHCGTIVIEGGHITATGGKYGAGIGGGDNGYGGRLTVYYGEITATGGDYGAGIGSGDEPGNVADMKINFLGGKTTAKGGKEAAGVGGGNEGRGATVYMNKTKPYKGWIPEVYATGGDYGAGIGGGDEGNGGSFTIDDGHAEGRGGIYAAGIGGGAGLELDPTFRYGTGATVTINGGEVRGWGGSNKQGGWGDYTEGGAGIGGGRYGLGGFVTITGGDVLAEGGNNGGGAGIGGGYGRGSNRINISGGKVVAKAYRGGAGIGGGATAAKVVANVVAPINISGGEVEANANNDLGKAAGAAIGSGAGGYADTITISGGKVKAIATCTSQGAAAIGGGYKGYFGTIDISGDATVVDTNSTNGTGIGSGAESEKPSDKSVGQITISGGKVTGRSFNYNVNSTTGTGAGIGSGNNCESPVHVTISGGNVEGIVQYEEDLKYYSGAGIGSGYKSPMGIIEITGGTILARRGTGNTAADPIGWWNDETNSVYPSINFNYDKAQIRNETGAGTDKRVKNTQYDDDPALSRELALLQNDTDWVEIKPCDHEDMAYEIVSAGMMGTHKEVCDYCCSPDLIEERHTFDKETNKCKCGYYRYKLIFTDGEDGEDTSAASFNIYPDLSSTTEDGVDPNKTVKLVTYTPTFVLEDKKFIGWKLEGDSSGKIYTDEDTYTMNSDTTFVAQWEDDHVHDWLFRDFTWEGDDAKGYTKAVANYVCSKNSDHTKTVQANVNNEIVTPDCTTEGSTTYTATIAAADSPDGNAHSEDKVVKTDALGHLWGDWSDWEQQDSTYVRTRKCSQCGNTQTEVKEHSHKDKFTRVEEDPATCTENGVRAHNVCTCGYWFEMDDSEGNNPKDPKEFTISALGHDWGEWTEKKAPTCSAMGEETRTCERDSSHIETRAVAIDTYLHEWGDPTYKWSEDYSVVKATCPCKFNNEHEKLEIVETSAEVTKKATCEEKGETTYTATFYNAKFEEQKKTVEDIDALGHDFGDWKKLNDDQHQRVCSHDSSHVVKENHKWNSGKVTKEPTTSSEGEKEYTCTVCNATKTEVIPKLDPKPAPVVTAAPKIKTVGRTDKKTMTVTWSKVDKAKSYKLAYRKVGSKWKYKTTTKRKYVVKKHKIGGLYEYKVAAISPTGVEKWSAVSYRYMKTVKDKVKGGKRSIKVSWKKIKGVSGYEIRLSTSKSMKNPKIVRVSAKTKSYKFKKLKKGKRYYVKVRPLKDYNGHTYIGVLCGRKSAKAK